MTTFPHPDRSDRLKAQAGLGYQDFLRLVAKLWLDSHPGIPVIATGDRSFGQYPVIIYRLDLRKAHPAEPKPRFREEIHTSTGDAIIISGQRFQSVITFSVITEIDPGTAETLVEEFQDFMLEFTPVFKELGLSEIVFMRRLPDFHDSRPGEGIVGRSVSYLVTTETIVRSFVPKLEEIIVDARVFISTDNVLFETNPSQDTIFVYGATYKIGDRVRITARASVTLPFPAGDYYISNVISGDNLQYTLARLVTPEGATPDYTNLVIDQTGGGYITSVPESDVHVTIADTQSALGS